MDDLLLCSPSQALSQTPLFLTSLALKDTEHLNKTPNSPQTSVTYLGLKIIPTTKALTTDRLSLLRDLCPSSTGEQILSFLVLTGFFRHWVPNYASLAKPLYTATKDTPTRPLSSKTEVKKSFYNLHSALLSSSPLFLPNPNLPYHLYTDEKGSIIFRALIQPAGPEMLPMTFISKQLDPTTQRWFPCLCDLAAAASLYANAKKRGNSSPPRDHPSVMPP